MWRTRGHDAAIELLKSSLSQDRVSHAYLITGPDHVGKSTLARELALALNCATWQGEPQGSLFGAVEPAPQAEPGPCYECSACRKALAGAYPDLLLVEQWTTEGSRIIDQIRSIQYASGLLPYEGRRKVYVLLQAHDLTLPAQNALLKTLEEPAPTVCLILAATTTQALLPTVVSRCQQIQLRAPSAEVIARALEDLRGLEASEADSLAKLSAGRIGWALDAASDGTLLKNRQAALEFLTQALGASTSRRFQIAEQLASVATGSPEEVDEVLELWLTWLRDVLLVVAGLHNRVVTADQLQAIEAVAGHVDSRTILAAIQAVQTARWQVQSSINTRMALEVLMLRLPTLGNDFQKAASTPPAVPASG